MKKTILFIANFSDVFDFFERFIPAMKANNLKPVFLTNKYSIYRRCNKQGVQVYPFKKCRSEFSGSLPIFLEKLTGTLTAQKAQELYQSVKSTMKEIADRHNPEYLFMWSGIRLIERAAADFANTNSIKTLFLELGNFPGKIFADPEGTNAGSLIARDKSILQYFQSDKTEYEKWKNSYVENSLKKHFVPQSAGAGSIDVWKNIWDLYGVKLKGFLPFEPVLSGSKLKNKWLKQRSGFNYDSVNLDKTKYIFYPMQVSDDAQILINSKIDNFGAVQHCSETAKKHGLELLVKPHPAERNIKFIEEFQSLQKKHKFYFVNGNTIELISKAEHVITINSTVGLQAKLLGKPTECLGKAFFADFSEDDLAAYLLSYLIDSDFWGTHPLSAEVINEFLNRAELGRENVPA